MDRNTEYIEITDYGLKNLIDNHMTHKLRKEYEFKRPIIGKDRGKYFIPVRLYANLIYLLLNLRSLGGEGQPDFKADWYD